MQAICKKCSEESRPNDSKTNINLYLKVSKMLNLNTCYYLFMFMFVYYQITLNLLNYVSNLMDGGWATGGQRFKRRILNVSVYTDPFSFNSGKKN